MPKSIENHKISVTIATVFLCCVFIATGAYNIGAKQTKMDDEIKSIKADQKKCEQTSREDKAKQDKLNQEFKRATIELSKDVKYILKTVEELKRAK